MNFNVYYKECFYFGLMTVISLCIYMGLAGYLFFGSKTLLATVTVRTVIIYALILIAYRCFTSIIFTGYLKGNAIKVDKTQFSQAYDILENHSRVLGLKNIPDMYILQGNGILNAFATRVAWRNYVVLYSDIYEMALQGEMDAVSFIIGHELAHLKRGHTSLWKSILILPAKLIPLLNRAYSRACEYTCDNFGYELSSKKGITGLLILAAGKKLYKQVSMEALLYKGAIFDFSIDFSEIFSTHPHLINRLTALDMLSLESQ